jgi:hypothetical protein
MRAVESTFLMFGVLLGSVLMAQTKQSVSVVTVDACHSQISLLGDTPSAQFRRWPESKIRDTRGFLDACLGKFGESFDSMECAIVDSVNTDTRAVLDSSERLPLCGSHLSAGSPNLQSATPALDLSAGLVPKTQPKSAFKCGDELRPGIPYKQLADCYEAERRTAKTFADGYLAAAVDAQKAKNNLASQGSFTIDGTVYTDMKSLAGKYNQLYDDFNDVVNKYNANLKSWVVEEQECNAQEARLVADYNNLVTGYNSLLRVANAPASYPVYTPTQPQRIYCHTAFSNTSCYWQ